MVVWVKALLFVAGGVTAAAGTAYLTGMLDPWLGREPVAIASLPQATGPAEQESPAAVVDEDTVPLPEEATSTGKGDRIVAPSFDLLRVEPDGSLVVAGNAAGESTVEILSGETVIGSAKAGAGGDFVIVLDDPLAPGDYQLSLRSMAGDVVSLSKDTAVVSVPETLDGQVLALVDKPGAPAELVTVPQAQAGSVEEDAEQPVAHEGSDAETPQQRAAVTEDAAEPAAETSEAGQDGEVAAAADTAVDGANTQNEATTPAADDDTAANAGEKVAAAPAPQEASQGTAEQAPDVQQQVVVEAVEIEGGTVFVAGSAAPGSTVRVYANDILLGDARASEAGRFLVEANRELPVGDYLIRADLLDANGAVLARAAVPFQREPGETIAAVAPSAAAPAQEPQGGQDEPAATGSPAAPAGQEARQRGQTDDAPQQDVSGTTNDQAAAEPDDTVPAGEEAAPAPDMEVSIASDPAATAAEATAPALERVNGSVIIRRGDSLWRISRRVYGRGVRYSTIYLANQDQIRDPDMIWPGQVFAVPRETPEGETADMGAIGEQAVAPGGEGEKAAQ